MGEKTDRCCTLDRVNHSVAARAPRMTVSHTHKGLPVPSAREQGGHRLASERVKAMGTGAGALDKAEVWTLSELRGQAGPR